MRLVFKRSLQKLFIIGSLVIIHCGKCATVPDCSTQAGISGPECPRNCGSSTVNGDFYDEGVFQVSNVRANITSGWNGPGPTPPQTFTTDLLYSGLPQYRIDTISSVRCRRNNDMPSMCRIAKSKCILSVYTMCKCV